MIHAGEPEPGPGCQRVVGPATEPPGPVVLLEVTVYEGTGAADIAAPGRPPCT